MAGDFTIGSSYYHFLISRSQFLMFCHEDRCRMPRLGTSASCLLLCATRLHQTASKCFRNCRSLILDSSTSMNGSQHSRAETQSQQHGYCWRLCVPRTHRRSAIFTADEI